MDMMLFTRLIKSRACAWQLFASTTRGYLNGVLNVAGVPVARRVLVKHRASNTMVASTVSDPTNGTWRIDDLPTLEYYDVVYVANGGTGERDVIIPNVSVISY